MKRMKLKKETILNLNNVEQRQMDGGITPGISAATITSLITVISWAAACDVQPAPKPKPPTGYCQNPNNNYGV